jgi:hypothetical protein
VRLSFPAGICLQHFSSRSSDSVRAPTQPRSDFSWGRSRFALAGACPTPGIFSAELVFFLLVILVFGSLAVWAGVLCSGLFVCCVPVLSALGEFVTAAILFGNCLLLCSCWFSFCLVNSHHRSEVLPEFVFWFSILFAGTVPPVLICQSMSALWTHLCCDLDCCRWESVLFLSRRIKGSGFSGSCYTLEVVSQLRTSGVQ